MATLTFQIDGSFHVCAAFQHANEFVPLRSFYLCINPTFERRQSQDFFQQNLRIVALNFKSFKYLFCLPISLYNYREPRIEVIESLAAVDMRVE